MQRKADDPSPTVTMQRTSLSATRMGASGSRRFMVRSKSMTVPASVTHDDEPVMLRRARAATVGQNHAVLLFFSQTVLARTDLSLYSFANTGRGFNNSMEPRYEYGFH